MSLENIIKKPANMALGRIGWNSLWSGLLGSFFQPTPYSTLAGAAAGFSLTLYDELTNKNMNLSYPFWGVAIGGFIGNVLEGNYKSNNIITYVGLSAGGSLGLLKSYSNSLIRRKKKGEVINYT